MQKLRVAFGRAGNLGQIDSQTTIGWDDFRERYLDSYTTTGVTVSEYAELSKDERGAVKGQGGWFVGGTFKNRRRRRDNFGARSMVTLDLDHLSPLDIFDLEIAFSGIECVAYATHSSVIERPRLRLVFPLQRDVTYDEYQPVARYLADRLNLDLFDDTSFEAVRLMYLPCRASDGSDYIHYSRGDWPDPDEILATYEDPTDFGSWPRSSRVKELRVTTQRADDPRDKPGIIGAFCRVYDVHRAIELFIPDEWELSEDGRYRPAGSTGGAPGAVVYDDGLFLYSHHETGPTAGLNVNAWDLVRLCRFGEADNGATDTPIGERPSQLQMMVWASELPEIQADLAAVEFEGLDAAKSAPVPGLTYEMIAAEIAKHPDGTLDRVDFQTLVRRVAAARLDATDVDHLCNLLKLSSSRPLTKGAIKISISREHKKLVGEVAKDGTLSDVELLLLEEFENEHYPNNTLKRIGMKYWSFEHGLWAMLDNEVIHGQLTRTIIRLREERPEEAEQLIAVVQESKTSTQTRALHGMLEGLLAAREDRDDPLRLRERTPLPIVNCWNQEIRYTYAGERSVHAHDPAQFRTTRVDTEYDPSAECPLFDAFLAHCFAKSSNPELMQSFIEELGGYIVGTSRWLKLWVLFHGGMNTGKSTLAQVFTTLLGDSAVERSLLMLSGTSDFRDQGLIGKLLYVDDDLDKGVVLPDGPIKRLSEEKMIQTQIKYGQDLRFFSKSLPLVCSNHWPMTRDLTQAFVERTIVVPFRNPYKRSEISDEVKDRMISGERSGILNRFIVGLSRLRKRGHFNPPGDIERTREEWLTHANPVAAFYYTGLKRKAGHFVKSSQMCDWYREWHADEGQSRRPLPRNEFYSRLEPLAGPRITVQGTEGWRGYTRVENSARDEAREEFDRAEQLGEEG